MEGEREMTIQAGAGPHVEEAGRVMEEGDRKDSGGPTWRGFALSILVAIILSVMVTLLLGGSWSSYSLRPAVTASQGSCGGSCCPPQPEEGK